MCLDLSVCVSVIFVRTGCTLAKSGDVVAHDLDLHFEDQIFESRLNVIISQTLTDEQTLPLSTNRKSHVGFRLVYLHLTLAHSKGQV